MVSVPFFISPMPGEFIGMPGALTADDGRFLLEQLADGADRYMAFDHIAVDKCRVATGDMGRSIAFLDGIHVGFIHWL